MQSFSEHFLAHGKRSHLGRRLGLLLASASLFSPCVAFAGSEKTWNDAGSIGRDALVVAALAIPAVKGNWNGDVEAVASIGSAFAITALMKESFPERRPDGSDNKSFPSGHTSVSFAAAASLQNRYGWKIGLPAQAVAAFVGISRIQARKHHWYDVLAGAAIGETSGFLITNKFDQNVRIFPWGDTQSAGVAFSMRF